MDNNKSTHKEDLLATNNEVTSSAQEKPSYYLDDELLQELRDFCESFNPYEEISFEDKLRLKAYGISLDDPFTITNKLLLLLENNLQYRMKMKEANDN